MTKTKVDTVLDFSEEIRSSINAILRDALEKWDYRNELTEFCVSPTIYYDFNYNGATVEINAVIKLELPK